MSATTSNDRLERWVDEWAAILQPDSVYWCDGSAEEYDRLAAELVESGTFTAARRRQAPQQLLGPLRPGRRRPGRGPHVHLLGNRRARRAEQQLARPRRDARRDARRCTTARCAAARCTSSRSRWARSARASPTSACSSPTPPTSRSSMRIMTRMGQAALDVLGDGDWVHCLHSVGAPLEPGEADVPWPCDADNKYIVHFPEHPRDLVVRLRVRRQRPARQEVLRAAHRVGDGPRRRLARRAHADPQAHQPGRPLEVHRRRLPVGVRQDQPGDARPHDPGLDGGDDRRRHLLDEVRRRRAAVRDQPGGRLLRCRARHRLRHQPQRDGHAVGQRDLHQHRAHRRAATCGGRA